MTPEHTELVAAELEYLAEKIRGNRVYQNNMHSFLGDTGFILKVEIPREIFGEGEVYASS